MAGNASRYAALECILFGIEFGFYELGRSRHITENMKANRTIADVVTRLGARLVGEECGQYVHEIRRADYEKVSPRYRQLFLDQPSR